MGEVGYKQKKARSNQTVEDAGWNFQFLSDTIYNIRGSLFYASWKPQI